MKNFIVTILMIVCMFVSAVKSMAQVVNHETATISVAEVSEPKVVADYIATDIWVNKVTNGFHSDVEVHEIASNYIWFVRNHARTLFHWDGANLMIVDLFMSAYNKSTRDAMPICVDNGFQYYYTVQADGSLGANYPQPSMNILSFSALNGWKNKKVREESFDVGYVFYNKKSTIYEGMLLGSVGGKFSGMESELHFLFYYDVIVEKKKITLKIYKTDLTTPEHHKQIFFERVFTVDK
ncbi:MAG: hypothetical protein IKW39_05465 [Alphaproteobacteria bacterium]|nr:hypothetical protein [Alphaproteobacteria bacterium]